MSSICCNAKTKIGYYNINQRPDIHGIKSLNIEVAICEMGTFCTKCEKLCDFISEQGKEYYTNGIIKTI